jgi:hypothetical protein
MRSMAVCSWDMPGVSMSDAGMPGVCLQKYDFSAKVKKINNGHHLR